LRGHGRAFARGLQMIDGGAQHEAHVLRQQIVDRIGAQQRLRDAVDLVSYIERAARQIVLAQRGSKPLVTTRDVVDAVELAVRLQEAGCRFVSRCSGVSATITATSGDACACRCRPSKKAADCPAARLLTPTYV